MAELSKLGRYQLRRILGKGAMGVVYDGYDPTINRRVAIKIILKSHAIDEEMARAYSARFVREAQAAGRISHPNIVQIYDFGEEEDIAYLVMEFIQGRELRSFFSAKESFEIGESVRIMGELLDALDFAHEARVIHRDVKPANVMLDAQRRVKLADFGVARIQDSERSAADTMVGTPAYMSPEQISGNKIDRRTDIFSAGSILYQLLTGEQPFKGEGAWTVAKQIMQDDPPLPSRVTVSVSPAFDAIVNKALAKDPAQRFANAREFAGALRRALGGQANAQAPASLLAPSAPKRRTKPDTKASEAEVEFWRSIQNSTDPHEFEFYLEQFPEGTYSQLARHKIAKLREPLEAARREAEEKARLEAEEAARREAQERAQREAEEKAKRETEERARKEAEDRARRQAEEQARREAQEKAKRDAEAKARREAEERVRQSHALARLRQQEEAAARAKPAVDEDATVAIGSGEPAAAAPQALASPRKSLILPATIAAVVIAGGIGAYLLSGRTPAPPPVAVSPPVQKAEIPLPAAAKPAVTAPDIEKIKKETEDRVRREFADKSAAEQAELSKVAAEKAVQEKLLMAKAAAANKAAAERVAAEKAASDKAAATKVAAEKLAVELAAAEKAAAEKTAAERTEAENAAAERATAEKAAKARAVAPAAIPSSKLRLPSPGDAPVTSNVGAAGVLEQFMARHRESQLLTREPLRGTMKLNEVVYVNDRSCPDGEIKEVTGGSNRREIKRTLKCVKLSQ